MRKEILKVVAFCVVLFGGMILLFAYLDGYFYTPDPNQATMPDEFLITRLDQVPEGKEVKVANYCLEVDDNKKIWIGKTSRVDDHSFLWVKRVGNYVEIRVRRQFIDARKEDFRWKQTTIKPKWLASSNFPVSKFAILEEPQCLPEIPQDNK
jgi:hypothetical protein